GGLLGPARRSDLAPDAARGEGTRIPRRVHRRPGGRTAAASLGQQHQCRRAGRGAAAVLCRYDAGRGSPVPQPSAEAALARRPALAATVALSRRYRGGTAAAESARQHAPKERRPAAQPALGLVPDREVVAAAAVDA